MYTVRHALKCPDQECKADLTQPGAVNVHYVAGGHGFDLCSQLDETGLLQDGDDLISFGLHGGSRCNGCSEELEELLVEELLVEETPGEPGVNLTWNELLTRIQQMNASELFDNVTVHTAVLDEFYPVSGFGVSKDGDAADGILDHGHLYLEVDG